MSGHSPNSNPVDPVATNAHPIISDTSASEASSHAYTTQTYSPYSAPTPPGRSRSDAPSSVLTLATVFVRPPLPTPIDSATFTASITIPRSSCNIAE
ncbi:hypothetical protein BDB00DRAFT_843597 [Zychaea mexicana]|uniref:uncharacterized protein n=1 Tax=Zychaea mexicana TaxID=64656 RepID=UPI0022FEE29C|nr:uncharacterized protein BDB00DRAFT_843597 [Zychaea mexicana]KAI9489382.1 hypothetical protein BDB00DRAFT_843597 [Zychaea mexicana]